MSKYLDKNGFTQFVNWVKSKFSNIEQELFAMELNSQEYARKDDVPKWEAISPSDYEASDKKDGTLYFIVE